MKIRNRILEMREIKAADLQDNSGNWRRHPKFQRDALAGVLAEVGIAGALTAYHSERQGGLTLIDGHLRRGDYPDVAWPVLVLDVDDREADLLLASLDPLAALAQADAERLERLLEVAKAEDERVAAMLADLAKQEGVELGGGDVPEDPGPQIDRAAELQEKWQVERGQVWQVGRHRVMCGDATAAGDVERLMGGATIRFGIHDPPYGTNTDTAWLSALHIQRGKPPNVSDDRLQGDDGSLDISCAFRFEKWLVWGFPFITDSRMTGWLVWDKWPGADNGLGNPIEMASTNLWNGFRLLRVMWGGYYRAKGENREAHPTQKPLGVIRPVIEGNTKSDDAIADLFFGSGTTLVACEQTGRIGYGMEIEPKYCAVTLERLSAMGLEPKLVQS